MKFKLGINYWPANTAMYWWERFEIEEVSADFQRIAAAGFDSVRIFLLWEHFQPAEKSVSDVSLRRLLEVADLAGSHGLSIVPTLFTGHMSGVNWIPGWALESRSAEKSRFRVLSGGKILQRQLANWYSEPAISSAQALLTREVVSALRGHSSVWAYDLGNENSNCVVPPTRDAAIRWLERMTNEIRRIDSTALITIGLHMEDLEEDRNLGPQEASRVCDFLCMHGYPIYANFVRGPQDVMLLPFLAMITTWLGGLDVLFEEFGVPAVNTPVSTTVTLLNEGAAARFTREALEALIRFGTSGAMLWCYADYASWLWSWPPLEKSVHERYFGLWHADQSPKRALREISAFKNVPRREPSNEYDWITIDKKEYYSNPAANIRLLFAAFVERFGQQPQNPDPIGASRTAESEPVV
jgi:endo-1,4-beta-mannosidase